MIALLIFLSVIGLAVGPLLLYVKSKRKNTDPRRPKVKTVNGVPEFDYSLRDLNFGHPFDLKELIRNTLSSIEKPDGTFFEYEIKKREITYESELMNATRENWVCTIKLRDVERISKVFFFDLEGHEFSDSPYVRFSDFYDKKEEDFFMGVNSIGLPLRKNCYALVKQKIESGGKKAIGSYQSKFPYQVKGVEDFGIV